MSNSSNKRTIPFTRILFSCAALAVSAGAGAWVQASMQDTPVLSHAQERVIVEQVTRDGAYVRQNVELLAEKVGDLQARLIAMDGLGQRIAQVAGVSYTNPELQETLAATPGGVMDDIPEGLAQAWTAESLGRELDTLSRDLERKRDWFSMLDLVLTERTGLEASLPTFAPVEYPYTSSSFGWRQNPVTGRHSMHEGLDFAAPRGTPIYAASGGVVTEARYLAGYGKTVEISHGNGLVTRYAHASSINVKLGDVVEQGDMIARVGSTGRSTGPHLHFEVRMAGHPLDPTLFLGDKKDPEHLMAQASERLDAEQDKLR